jgi:phosphatidylglycerol lysyltransferase
VIGLASHVPGGLGVFESILLLLLSSYTEAQTSTLIGSLLVYRVIYYLLPLVAGAALLGIHEIVESREGLRRAARIFGRWVPELAPNVLAVTVFVGGGILLFSGVTPVGHAHAAWLTSVLPAGVMDAAHFAGSLAGVGLLFLARGLQRRIDSSYVLSSILLGVGIVCCILKGLDYTEAAGLAIMLGALLPCRGQFYRKAPFLGERFTVGWAAATLIVLLSVAWIGVFFYKIEKTPQDLWAHFIQTSDVGRFLREAAGAWIVVGVFALVKLLHGPPPRPVRPGPAETELARRIIADSPVTLGNLALLGDKTLLFNEKRSAFIMYAVEGRSWVAMGDPVGPDEEKRELLWSFRELVDFHEGWAVFYEIDRDHLALYLDLGLTPLKLGEEAHVDLAQFNLDGHVHKALRHTVHRFAGEGYGFEIVPADGVAAILPELEAVSETCLGAKDMREMGFSMGFFSADYLKQFPAGIVRKDGKIVAFANVWSASHGHELSTDLMRHVPEVPHAIMDYLFVRLMLWGKENGYRCFNMGMAPLSAIQDPTLGSVWNRLATYVFRHGGHFDAFAALRQYKEKFHPTWHPKFVAVPGGLALPHVFTNIASLISRGPRGAAR